jgi:cytochrome bd-type quinol oxidase subunit 2
MMRVMNPLFPFRSKFRQLSLERLWWHRLLVVLFIVALVVMLGGTWLRMNHEEAEGRNSYLSQITETHITDIQNYVAKDATPQEMKALDDRYAEDIRNSVVIWPIHHWINLGIAAVLTLLLSYLLQVIYRISLYIGYGRQRPDATESV